MARSLTITKEETPSTSPLLTAFLLLAFGWLGLSGVVAMANDSAAVEPPVFYAE